MTWEIVLGLIALVGFIASIGGFVWRLSSMIARLEKAVETMTKAVESLRIDNDAEHRRLSEKLENHETRIIKIETKVG